MEYQIIYQNLEQEIGLKLMMNQEEIIRIVILDLKLQC